MKCKGFSAQNACATHAQRSAVSTHPESAIVRVTRPTRRPSFLFRPARIVKGASLRSPVPAPVALTVSTSVIFRGLTAEHGVSAHTCLHFLHSGGNIRPAQHSARPVPGAQRTWHCHPYAHSGGRHSTLLDGQRRHGPGAHRLGQDPRLRACPCSQQCDPDRRGVQALVLVPTRELAIQVAGVIGAPGRDS